MLLLRLYTMLLAICRTNMRWSCSGRKRLLVVCTIYVSLVDRKACSLLHCGSVYDTMNEPTSEEPSILPKAIEGSFYI
jgi:hypothetical protein